MSTTEAPPIPRHPAKFSKPILAAIRKVLVPEAQAVGHLKVLDVFAGQGGVHELAEQCVSTLGVELQPEWAAAHPDTIVGDATALPAEWRDRFDALVTSPCYGNRMADHHDARDTCKTCAGTGTVPLDVADGEVQTTCKVCHGAGLSRRNTYAHALRESGHDLVPGSAAGMPWGPRYRAFHEAAWREAFRVLRPGGLAVINAKNHGDPLNRVVEFHLNIWLMLGCTIERAIPVPLRGNQQGANRDVREDHEMVLVLRMPPAA